MCGAYGCSPLVYVCAATLNTLICILLCVSGVLCVHHSVRYECGCCGCAHTNTYPNIQTRIQNKHTHYMRIHTYARTRATVHHARVYSKRTPQSAIITHRQHTEIHTHTYKQHASTYNITITSPYKNSYITRQHEKKNKKKTQKQQYKQKYNK